MSSHRPWVSCYFPPLGVNVLASKSSGVRVYDAQTGILNKETLLVTCSTNQLDARISIRYFSPNERLVIAKGTEFNARRHFNESILLHGFLNKPVQIEAEKVVLEFDSYQGLFWNYFFHVQLNRLMCMKK
ncbi:unnamed protein product [Heterobilharzia americana]|nr:unnamed protein product [Heterobilharzia americana]